MEDIPLSWLGLILAVLLVLSGFFAMAETAMMASNRYRLRALADNRHHGAMLTLGLLAQTDRLLGVILLFNTVINAGIATLAGIITIELFGEEKWALGVGTMVISFLILVFAEITPKVLGAAHADKLAIASAYLLKPTLAATRPLVSFLNLFVAGLLRLFHLTPSKTQSVQPLSPAELRALVLESSHNIPRQHRDILLNLFDLERVTVEDIMVPRGEIEAIDIEAPIDEILSQLSTSYHTRLPVVKGDPGNVIGILHLRRMLGSIIRGPLDMAVIREQLVKPYFIPAATPVYTQLQFFRENRQRQGLVVDEYGELMGLVTLEDIIEEIVGKFTTSAPGATADFAWDNDGTVLVDGSHALRELNRVLALDLPVDGPKTLSGLVVEYLQDIPETGVCLRVAGVAMEIVQTQDRRIKIVKLFRPLSIT
ncbi:MAG TPA: CNNM domain-containing protein [Rhodocyclaceae bacterium]|nr:CNNM domain-containing protein [Rhodocyclaceae bacterium]